MSPKWKKEHPVAYWTVEVGILLVVAAQVTLVVRAWLT